MFYEYRSALMLLTRWTAPTRRVCHREKGQRRRRGRFCPTVQSAACSELLTPSERNRPEKNTSCCDPDKDPSERQVAGSQRPEIGSTPLSSADCDRKENSRSRTSEIRRQRSEAQNCWLRRSITNFQMSTIFAEEGRRRDLT